MDTVDLGEQRLRRGKGQSPKIRPHNSRNCLFLDKVFLSPKPDSYMKKAADPSYCSLSGGSFVLLLS